VEPIVSQKKSKSEPKKHQTKKSAWLTLFAAHKEEGKAILDANQSVEVGRKKATELALGHEGATVTITGSKIKLNAKGNDVTINGAKIKLG
jgi:hypothetical protein